MLAAIDNGTVASKLVKGSMKGDVGPFLWRTLQEFALYSWMLFMVGIELGGLQVVSPPQWQCELRLGAPLHSPPLAHSMAGVVLANGGRSSNQRGEGDIRRCSVATETTMPKCRTKVSFSVT